jgi:cephalosporin hydroxylase
MATILLPGEFGCRPRSAVTTRHNESLVRMLCVSTLEPRKNHRALIEACLRLAENHPQLQWSLTLVGSKYEGAADLAEWIHNISQREQRIQWLGVVDDSTLARLYEESSFTVYPSEIEGFGLPILESIWHGCPCICYNQGVMNELARGGGCLTTDVTDPARLENAIYELGTNVELWSRLSREAAARPLKSWRNYVEELSELLRTFAERRGESLVQNALYPYCLLEQWQMNDSERIALAGLLERHRPACSIEVGTFRGGSLSLIAEYSRFVFSIDIDETVASRFHFSNVAFLTGRSHAVLPQLFVELDRCGTAVDFILIDGDHSREGVLNDITCLLQYVPKKPLVVVLHDSFNPECRRGMLEARWHASPYCHAVDLDFVPGRMVEHGGPFREQLWGGLALAYFLPYQRSTELEIRASTEQMYERLSKRSPDLPALCSASAGAA